jgi:hypothetical protein
MPRTEVVELRQYTLLGGQRDELARLFEREFVSTQEAEGAQVLGTYRDLDDADRFIWFRGFETLDDRASALAAFYGGAAWKANREAANATMLDSDNVLLLRPPSGVKSRPDLRIGGEELMLVSIHYLGATSAAEFAAFFETVMRPALWAAGAEPLTVFVTEPAQNNFPPLPVREGEPALVWLARFADRPALQRFEDAWSALSGWRDAAPAAVLPALMRKPERLRLAAL